MKELAELKKGPKSWYVKASFSCPMSTKAAFNEDATFFTLAR